MTKAVALVYNAADEDGPADEADVLIQVRAVGEALDRLGYVTAAVPCDLDLGELGSALEALRPSMVFNLTESMGGNGRLIHVVPSFLETLGLPYTGCPAEVIAETSHKVRAKERMKIAGLPTPDWINPFPPDLPWTGAVSDQDGQDRLWIMKSLWEHASLGLDDNSLIRGTAAQIRDRLEKGRPDMTGAFFAEAFIEGREFNLSLLETDQGMQVLPPAEIRFQDREGAGFRMVGYRAKWDPASIEYQSTPRSFDFRTRDKALLSVLVDLARRCWRIFNLKGYARVDFRVDEQGRPFILEVNANPCISPDAGFAAALERAGISYAQAIQAILNHPNRPAPSNRETYVPNP